MEAGQRVDYTCSSEGAIGPIVQTQPPNSEPA